MGFEQPRFDVEDTGEDKPSNVIEGPWPKQESGPEEISARESARSNIIEGPWPRRELEPAPEIEEPVPPEVVPDKRMARSENAQEELLAPLDEPKGELEPGEPKEGEKELHRFIESFEQYKPCEACGGKGRRWLVFSCPVCKGFGSIRVSSSRREGYMR